MLQANVFFLHLEPFKRQPHKIVKHTQLTQTIRWQKLKNCLSVFDHFVGLALKGLMFLEGIESKKPEICG